MPPPMMTRTMQALEQRQPRLHRLAWAAAMLLGPAVASAQPTAAAAATPVAGAQVAAVQVPVTCHYDNIVGSSDAASQGVITAELLKSRPALRPGELLEFVPGVIVTQHSETERNSSLTEQRHKTCPI